MSEYSELLQVIKIQTGAMLSQNEALFTLAQSISELAAAIVARDANDDEEIDTTDCSTYLDGSSAKDS